MRIVVQRVAKASVTIGEELRSEIGKGMLVLVGIEDADGSDDVEWLCSKLSKLRIFEDDKAAMNLDISSVDGSFLVVSQFTLFAMTKKGNRPSYMRAAGHELAVPIYEKFCARLSELTSRPVQKGVFGADMQCALVNDGPVTIIIDSRIKE